ncbi:type II toxin-antitoxin system toxin DNA ADP-ribosyl transferase DarT [Chryseobacterium potabilaquae]|uniref:DarT domain-containing protein n=1 Tax=Chryseobacterium potabilaquae TaxID=2675057 RepID=A0A6N4XCL3_9FLAO|nr:DUF4433 domain-containing protein [Chryseobacterium potabilaquae]CAA7197192.1 hypothetical protein CHRY9293_03246 [Chryseobacterium potabilaquae]
MSKIDKKVYRMTHIENISHILKYGITHKNSLNSNPHFVNIGDLSLIDNREHKEVTVDNGDFLNFTTKSIKLGEYIPFYFGVKMPMLYIMQMGGNFVEKATKPEDIIYLVCSIDKIINKKLDFYFSDGHATNNYTSFYEKDQIYKMDEIVDWSSIKAPYWGGDENLNIKRKKQAEFLVSIDLSPDLIIGFGCYNENAKKRLIELGVEESKIKVIPQGYF